MKNTLYDIPNTERGLACKSNSSEYER